MYTFQSNKSFNVVYFEFLEAKADIIGGQDKMVESGSTLELTCLLRHSMEPPTYIFWYHDNKMINYDSSRGVIVKYSRFSSLIRIPGTRGRDSGNYTCVPSNARPASVNVHIIKSKLLLINVVYVH